MTLAKIIIPFLLCLPLVTIQASESPTEKLIVMLDTEISSSHYKLELLMSGLKLVLEGADINTQTIMNTTLLGKACATKLFEMSMAAIKMQEIENNTKKLVCAHGHQEIMLKSFLDEAKASIQQKLKNDLFITHIINFLMMHNASPQLIVTNPWDAYPEYVLPFVFDHIHNHHHNVTQNVILDINAQNDCGDTPLHEVIGYEIVPGYQPFGKLKTLCLLELGADTTLKNKKGETPFDRAQGDKKMEKLLSESSVRSIQMPFYKKNVQKNLAVTRHGKSQNLHNKINNRALGFK